jgi:hypothetical protein
MNGKRKLHTHTMEYYSATKKNKILSFTGKCIESDIILSEISQTQKVKYHMFLLIFETYT